MFSFLFKNVKIANRIYIYFCKGIILVCARAYTEDGGLRTMARTHPRY